MKKIQKSDFEKYILWAGANTANRVYPLSIAEGYQTGDIYVNDGRETEAVFFWHYCGFGYISGKASGGFLEDIYRKMSSGNGERRLVLISNAEEVIRFFRDKNVQMSSRLEYSYPGKDRRPVALDTERFRIEPIDRENITGIKGRIVPAFSWERNDRFLERGFGYVALENRNVCAAAFSSAVSKEEIDIGVETREQYRGNGLASALAGKMCDHILKIGKRPVWAHALSNAGSMNTALRCGFAEDRRNTVIQFVPA